MADLSEVFRGYSAFVLDYSALLEVGDTTVHDELVDIIINQEKKLFISKSFRSFHGCVSLEGNPREKDVVVCTRDMFSRLYPTHSIRESKHTSTLGFVLEHANNVTECLFLGRNSETLERIRDANVTGRCAVCVFSKERMDLYPTLDICLSKEKPISVSQLTQSNDYLDVEVYCNVGDIVYTEAGEEVSLVSKISTGAEGIVFHTKDPKLVAKIYHRGVITPLRWRKLITMRDMHIDAVGICWPCELLYTYNRVPVGYLMKTGKGTTLGTAFDGPDAMMEHFPDWERLQVAKTLSSTLSRMIYLHMHGILVGDIQLKNAMISTPDDVYLIDMDSVQVADMPCPVGTEEFTSPELWESSFVSFLRKPRHEDYSISILVFSLLFCGQHPYAQRNGRETLREEMQALAFPYSLDGSTDDRIPLGGYDLIWKSLSDRLREMFYDTFAKGRLYESIEWLNAVSEYTDMLIKREFEDEEMYHVFPYHVWNAKLDESQVNSRRTVREAIIHTSINDEVAMGAAKDVPLSSMTRRGLDYAKIPDSNPYSSASASSSKSTGKSQGFASNNGMQNTSSGYHSSSSSNRGKQAEQSKGLVEFLNKNHQTALLLALFAAAILLIIILSLFL